MTATTKRWVVSAGVPVELVTYLNADGIPVASQHVSPIDEELANEGIYRQRLLQWEQQKVETIEVQRAAAEAATFAAIAAKQVAYDEAIVLGFTEESARAISGWRG